MERTRVQQIYDRRAPMYDRSVGRGERLLVGDLRQAFGAALAGRTLEIAVGSGLNLPYYTDAVATAVGVDFSSGMLQEARNRAERLGRSIDLLQMDAHQLAFPDNSFDTVAISLALCTVSAPEQVLREMARVCRPDGAIVLLEHVLSPVWPVALLERIASPLQERMLGCHLDRRTLDLARDLGFSFASERRRFAGVFRLAVGRPPAL